MKRCREEKEAEETEYSVITLTPPLLDDLWGLIILMRHKYKIRADTSYYKLMSNCRISPAFNRIIHNIVIPSMERVGFRVLELHVKKEMLPRFRSIKLLSIESGHTMEDEHLALLTFVPCLRISVPSNITNNNIGLFTRLRSLTLNYHMGITDEGIKTLTLLDTLTIMGPTLIDGTSFKSLPLLRTLSLYFCSDMKSGIFKGLQLEKLIVALNANVGDEDIKELSSSLRKLYITECNRITDEGIQGLSRLKSLTLKGVGITNNGLKRLTTLTKLDLDNNTLISDEGVLALCNLKVLRGDSHMKVSRECVQTLRNRDVDVS